MDIWLSADFRDSIILIIVLISMSGVVGVIYFSLINRKTREKGWTADKAEKNKSCPVCGTRVPSGYKVCSSCGAEFPEESHTDDQERARQRLINKYQNEKKK